MLSKNTKIFIGVAWPYVNGDLHIGHVAGYLLPADIVSRYFRLRGFDVLMVSGSDCFGTPITVEAEKLKISPREVVKIYHPRNKKLFKDLGISFDIYWKTDNPFHRKIVQSFILEFDKKNLLFMKEELQYFDEKEKKFLPDRYVEGICPYCKFKGARADQCENCGKLLNQNLIDPVNKLTKEKVILKKTKSLFIDWPKIQKDIEKYFRLKSKNWKKWIVKETYGWLKRGLDSRAVSRDINWGVEFPKELIKKWPELKEKRIYVWFDAVIGYLSASVYILKKKNKILEDFWFNKNAYHYYFMGKDNLVFHTIFWPGQLMVYNEKIHLPDLPLINHYLNLEGEKFSKSRGVIIEIRDFIDKFGPDALRFYIWKIMPENKDSSFSWNDFYRTYNDILVGKVGNFLHRLFTLGRGANLKEPSEKIIKISLKYLQKSGEFIEKGQFLNYYKYFINLVMLSNKLIDKKQPWKYKNTKNFNSICSDLYLLALTLLILLYPVCPFGVKKYLKYLKIKKIIWPSNKKEILQIYNQIKNKKKPEIIFQKIKEEITENNAN